MRGKSPSVRRDGGGEPRGKKEWGEEVMVWEKKIKEKSTGGEKRGRESTGEKLKKPAPLHEGCMAHERKGGDPENTGFFGRKNSREADAKNAQQAEQKRGSTSRNSGNRKKKSWLGARAIEGGEKGRGKHAVSHGLLSQRKSDEG